MKKMIIKGVGTFMAKRLPTDPNGAVEVITLGTLQDLRIDLNVELEDIFGGDGLFAIDNLVRSKSIEVSATDAKFDLDAIQLMMGSKAQSQVDSYVHVLNEQHVAVSNGTEATIQPKFFDTLFGTDGEMSVRLKDSNKLLKKVALPATPDLVKVDEFAFDDVNEMIVLNDAHANKDVILNYKREEVVDLVDILVDEVPFPVSVVHHGSFLQKDGTFAGVETELFMCVARGTFSINAQRATASSSAISLQVLDPERADGKLGSIKRYSSTERV